MKFVQVRGSPSKKIHNDIINMSENNAAYLTQKNDEKM